jgi:hypothetical protein
MAGQWQGNGRGKAEKRLETRELRRVGKRLTTSEHQRLLDKLIRVGAIPADVVDAAACKDCGGLEGTLLVLRSGYLVSSEGREKK